MRRDVVIVGGGVVGTAIARGLSRYELRCTLVVAAPDIGARISQEVQQRELRVREAR